MSILVENNLEERPISFQNSGLTIRGFLHLANLATANTQKKMGYVFCDPFADEKKSCLRVYVDFARLFQKMGYSVFRFDYRGCGDSEGDFKTCTISSMCADIVASVNYFKESANLDQLGLLGTRLSTNLIIKILPEIQNLTQIILWEPILDLEGYFRKNILRRQLLKDLMTFGSVQQSREQMMQTLLNKSSFDFEGYEIGKDLVDEVICGHQTDGLSFLPENVLLIHFTITGRPTHEFQRINQLFSQHRLNTKSCVLKSLPIWNNHDIPEYQQLFKETGSWIKSQQMT